MNEMTRIVAPAVDGFKARFTSAEFSRMVELDAFGDARIELVDGELERMPPPKLAHSRLQGSTFAQLVAIFGVHRTCVEIGIDMGDNTVLGCDAAVLLTPLTENRWPKPEELLLAVEISETTLARDLGMKASRYAACGIPHYWVIDSAAWVIHVYYDPAGARYAGAAVVRFGEPLAVPDTDTTITID